MNYQRRTFRGRGGPTDGRLPKHNARRRKTKQASRPAVNKYGDDDPQQHPPSPEDENEEEEESVSSVEELAAAPTSTPTEPWREEIQHLKKRIRNVQESIQTGTIGISSPKVYQENVLNAVLNCIQEWRAILKYYEIEVETETTTEQEQQEEDHSNHPVSHEEDQNSSSGGDDGDNDDATDSEEEEEEEPKPSNKYPSTTIDIDLVKQTSLQVYLLLQLSVQCGPLQGSNPGYFKRCGSAVAKTVEDYLEQIPVSELTFSTKQQQAIQKWKQNAHKAALQNKEPSKTALAKQTGKSKKKKLMKKK